MNTFKQSKYATNLHHCSDWKFRYKCRHVVAFFFFFFFSGVLGFKLRALHLLGKPATIQATSFCFSFSDRVCAFALGQPQTVILWSPPLMYLGLQMCTIMPFFFSWDRVLLTLAWAASNYRLPIFASWVAGLIEMHHHAWPQNICPFAL
jgi:hypothetical protein